MDETLSILRKSLKECYESDEDFAKIIDCHRARKDIRPPTKPRKNCDCNLCKKLKE